MQLAFNIERSAVHSETQQRTFNALVSLADYTVRSGAVVHTETISYPNWIDEHEITSGYVERLRIASGLTELSIAFEPSDRGICIYRIVVVAKEPKQLFFCGD